MRNECVTAACFRFVARGSFDHSASALANSPGTTGRTNDSAALTIVPKEKTWLVSVHPNTRSLYPGFVYLIAPTIIFSLCSLSSKQPLYSAMPHMTA